MASCLVIINGVLQFSYFCHHAFNPSERNRCSFLSQKILQSLLRASLIQHCLSLWTIISSRAQALGHHQTPDHSWVITKRLHSLNQSPLFPHVSTLLIIDSCFFHTEQSIIVKHIFPSSSFRTSWGTATTCFNKDYANNLRKLHTSAYCENLQVSFEVCQGLQELKSQKRKFTLSHPTCFCFHHFEFHGKTN